MFLASRPGSVPNPTACDKLTRRAEFPFHPWANHLQESSHPVPEEGALAIVTERWDGMRWTRRHRARDGIAGRDKLRERFPGRADERCRGVRRSRVVPMPQWLASSLSEARKPNRAGVPVSARRRRQESPILREERDISRKAIAQGMSDRLRCPVCSCAIFFRPFAHGTAGAARIRHSLLPRSFEGQRNANLGRLPPRERGPVSAA